MRFMAVLVCAQMLTDFLLQPGWMAEGKRRPAILALHAAIHAAAAYALLQCWTLWQIPAFVFLSHALVDSCKTRAQETAWAFLIDQAAHLALVISFVFFLSWDTGGVRDWCGCGYAAIVVIAGFIAATRGAGFLVATVVQRLVKEKIVKTEGLDNGGRIIGELERALIYLMIFTGNAAGIGFLVTAKSILRYKETREPHLAEYVLIGTLLSFTLAIAIAYATRWALTLQ